MTDNLPPKWFMPAVIVALIWNLMGLAAFIGDMMITPEALAALSEAERAMYENQPSWAKIAFALAVVGGALGSLGLVLKKRWATPVLIVSLFGILLQMFHAFFLADALAVKGNSALIMSTLVVIIGIVLVWLGRKSDTQGWLS